MDDPEIKRTQAEAYQRMVSAYDSARNWDDVGISLSNIIDDTNKKIKTQGDHLQDALYQLGTTRWRRLQQTQFVYWPERQGHPRILLNGGQWDNSYTYLQEQFFVFKVTRKDLAAKLEEQEAQLFGAVNEDEVKVFWRGWQLELTDGPDLIASCKYCIAYLWEDGTVAAEPSNRPSSMFQVNAKGLVTSSRQQNPEQPVNPITTTPSSVRFPVVRRERELPNYPNIPFNKPRCS